MSSIISKLINLAGNITGTLTVANGGTGVTTSTGSGNVVLSTSPTLVTPALGTPASGTLTNCTGYPVVVPGTTSGLVSASGVPGNTTGSAIATGYVGEAIYGPSNKVTSFGSLTTAVIKNLATLTLSSAGVWLITANTAIKQTNNAFIPTTTFDFTVSSANSNSMVGCSGNNLNIDYGSLWPRASANNTLDSGQIVFTYVATTAAQLWLNCLVSFSGGTASAAGGFMAVRIG